MRLKLTRQRWWSNSRRVAIRAHWPWPVRILLGAVVIGFSAAVGLWAFEYGKEVAGLNRPVKDTIEQLQRKVSDLTVERDRLQQIVITSDTNMQTLKATEEKLAEQVHELETRNNELEEDLAFFQRLLPVRANAGDIAVRGFQLDNISPTHVRLRLLVMQQARKEAGEFRGKLSIDLIGTLGAKSWQQHYPEDPATVNPNYTLNIKLYQRLETELTVPEGVHISSAVVKILDASGNVRSTYTTKL